MNPFKIINKEVSEVFNIPVKDIKGKSQKDEILFARYACMHIARSEFGFNLRQIGAIFNRDHTAVINALKRSDDLVDTNRYYNENLSISWANVKTRL